MFRGMKNLSPRNSRLVKIALQIGARGKISALVLITLNAVVLIHQTRFLNQTGWTKLREYIKTWKFNRFFFTRKNQNCLGNKFAN